MRKRNSRYLAVLAVIFSACQLFVPVEKRVLSENDETRSAALARLADLSTEKKSEIATKLVVVLENPDSRVTGRAADALVVIGVPGIPAIKTKLTNPDLFVRIIAVSILGRIGPSASDAVSDLIICLSDPHPLMREEAAFALGNMGEKAAPLGHPALLPLTMDEDPHIREVASQSLKKMGIQPPPPPKSA